MTTDAENAARRAQVVEAYGSVLERHGDVEGDIWDVSELPYSKTEILEALQMQIARETNDDIAEIYKTSAVYLANYQEGVGSNPLRLMNIDPGEMIDAYSSGNTQRFDELVVAMAEDSDGDKREYFSKLVEEDLETIRKKILVAEATRQMLMSRD